MAGKQLGKFKQWAGEVISVRDKTIVTDEFRELEHDIELRRRGLYKLHIASEDYQHVLAKKKQSEAVDGEEKLLAIDGLGCVMIQHGEEFGEDSAFGTSLVNLGRAHCQVAALQEAFALQFDDTFLASIRQAEDEIREYQAQRKKLESRRLSYDAAITKLEKIKSGKKEKEKEKLEAEAEFETAKARYEEMAEDVRVRMYAIQENEYDLLRALTAFLDDEVHFVEQYLEVLKEAKATWVDETTLSQMETAKKRRPPPRPDSRFGSVRSTRSASKHSRPGTPQDSDSSEEAPQKEGRFSRALSLRKSDSAKEKEKEKEKEKDSNSNANRPRSRANSIATVASTSEKDKEKDKKRQSVAGWGLSKVSSLAHRGKKDKAKSKSKAGALMDDRDDVDSDEDSDDDRGEFNVSAARTSRPPSTHSSRHSTPVLPPAAPPRPGTKSSTQRQQAKKRVVALHDFAASSTDELSFRAGEQIVVVNEVLDGWWMGELNGKTGLFPTNYTEVLNVSAESFKPPIPRRPSPTARVSTPPNNDKHDREQVRDPVRSSAQAPRWLAATNTGQYSIQSDDDDEHPFGDSHMAVPRVPRGAFDAEDTASSTGDFSENERLVAPDADEHEFTSASATPARPPLPSRGSTTNIQSATTPKRAPPPPPPRRSTLNGNAPPIPNRPPISRSASSSQTNSAATSFVTVATATAIPGARGEELTFSPFDSPKDALFPERGCTNFRQDPFKASGVCANCFRMHV